MIKDCLEIFEKQYKKFGDAYILDSYVLGEGTYILVDKMGEIKQVLEVVKTKGEPDRTVEGYNTFCLMDYYSKLINMNKSMDIKKVIHSNNYLSFFVKKESLINGKLTKAIIQDYYYTLGHLEEKYKKPSQSKLLYETTLEKCGLINQEQLKQNEQWIHTHIFDLDKTHNIVMDKRYLKIFFESDEEEFKREGERYFFPNVFNAAEYNVILDESIYGIPSNNLGLNAKKPYLKHKTRKNEVPYLVSTEEVMLQKKFFDYLMNEVCIGHVNLYFSEEEGIKGYLSNELMTFRNSKRQTFTGYYLRIAKGKEVEIQDAESILQYRTELEGFKVSRSISIDYSKIEKGIEYGEIKELKIVMQMVHSRFFNNFMVYFGEPSDKLKSEVIRRSILMNREAFFEWFYKGNTLAIKSLFPKISRELIKNSIKENQMIRAKEQWMLRDAIIDYLYKGEDTMSDKMKPILDRLEEKLKGEEAVLESDAEYFCAVGQVAYYLLSLNKASKKTHALVNPLLNAKDDIQIKSILRRLFVKYNYDITQGGKRFRCLYAMVEGYIPEGKLDEDALLYGYLQDNLLYKRGEKENE